MKKKGVTFAELSKVTDVPIATLKRLKTDPNANPTLTSLIPIAKYFQINLEQLIGIAPLATHIPTNWEYVPIINWEQATQWPNINKENCEYTVTDARIDNNSFAVIVQNNDWPGFMENSILIIDPKLHPKQGDYVVTHRKGTNETTLKQLLYYEGNTYLKPLNPDFKTDLLTEDNYIIIGVMIQLRLNK